MSLDNQGITKKYVFQHKKVVKIFGWYCYFVVPLHSQPRNEGCLERTLK